MEQKEFSNWTDYDNWLVSEHEKVKQDNGEEKVIYNYDYYYINKIEETNGKILAEFEECIGVRS